MRYAAWRDINRLPLNDLDAWVISRNGYSSNLDEREAQNIISNWMPPNPILVGSPQSKNMMPPIMFSRFEQPIISRLKKYYRMLFIACLLPAIVLLFFWLIFKGSSFPLSSIAFTILSLMMLSEYFSLKTPQGVFERAMFFYWLRNDKSVKFIVLYWVLFGLSIGTFQFYVQYRLGGFDQLMLSYGLMYKPTMHGEYWRLITGPYFHYSALHFALNFANLLFIGTFASRIFGYRAALVFILGNIVSALCQMIFGGQLFDNYGGISGGVYSLFGLLIYRGLVDTALLPKGFNSLCFEISFFGIIISALLSSNSAVTAHITGLLFGFLCSVVLMNSTSTNKRISEL